MVGGFYLVSAVISAALNGGGGVWRDAGLFALLNSPLAALSACIGAYPEILKNRRSSHQCCELDPFMEARYPEVKFTHGPRSFSNVSLGGVSYVEDAWVGQPPWVRVREPRLTSQGYL